MRSLLITGGAGFIGSNFTLHWRRQHPEDAIVVLDALTYAGNPTNLESLQSDPRFRLVKGDIRDQQLVESLLREHRVDTLVHFAAESHVDRSIEGPDVFIDVNIVGTHNLLKAAKTVWLEGEAPQPHRFHHVSTDEVFGSLEPQEPAFEETTAYAPNSPYAASKAASDHLVRAYHHTYGLETTMSNCSNNYGPYHFPEKLIPLSIVNLLTGKPLPIYGTGENVRDWLHVEDHCAGIERVLLDGKPGETYNIGGENELTNIELIRQLCALTDELFAARPELFEVYPDASWAREGSCADAITFVRDRPGHDKRYAVDTAKIRRELHFRPSRTFAEGLKQTLDWYVDHEAWWQAILNDTYRDWIESQYDSYRDEPPESD